MNIKKLISLIVFICVGEQTYCSNTTSVLNNFKEYISKKTNNFITPNKQNFGCLADGTKIEEKVYTIAIDACTGYLNKSYNNWKTSVYGNSSIEEDFDSYFGKEKLLSLIDNKKKLNTYCLIKFLNTDTFKVLASCLRGESYPYSISKRMIFSDDLNAVVDRLANDEITKDKEFHKLTKEKLAEKKFEKYEKIKEDTINDIKWYIDNYCLIDLYTFLKEKGENVKNIEENFKNVEINVASSKLESGRVIAPAITNIRNSCFLNTGLQAIFASPMIRNGLLSSEILDNYKLKPLSNFFATLNGFNEALVCSATISEHRSKIVQKVETTENFVDGKQHDSMEFIMNCFINKLAEDAKEIERLQMQEKKPIKQLRLYDEMKSEEEQIIRPLKNPNGSFQERKSSSQNLSFTLSLCYYINGNSKDQQNKFFNLINLLEQNILDSYTNLRESGIKENYIKDLPKILMINLNRASYLIGSKIGNGVFYPIEMVLQDEKGVYVYRLVSVFNHVGNTATSGHYYAYVRGTNDKYYEQNDGKVVYGYYNEKMNEKMIDESIELFYENGWSQASKARTCVGFIYERVKEIVRK